MNEASQRLETILRKATDAINQQPSNRNGSLTAVGEENAHRLRVAADTVCNAVLEFAEEIRAAADLEAQRAIECTAWMDDTAALMSQFRQRFQTAQQRHQGGEDMYEPSQQRRSA